MNVIFIGDIVCREATEYVADRLPALRRSHDVDLVIANAENCAITGPAPRKGFGMTRELVDLLFHNGVDVITGGNHSWDGPDAASILIDSRVLRPYNIPDGVAGKGTVTLDIAGETVSIINLGSSSAKMPHKILPPYDSWLSAKQSGELPGTVIVDFHGDSVWEKMTFAFAVDGEVAAVLGTHTHEPTSQLHLLPNGTAVVPDAGMAGRLGGIGGFTPWHFVAAMKGEDVDTLPAFEAADGPMTFGAVLLETGRGKTTRIDRLGE